MLRAETAKKVPWWKYALATLGVVYLVGTGVWMFWVTRQVSHESGPSELALHPERQDEILAQRRADALKTQLGLTDDQAKQVAAIMQDFQASRKEKILADPEGGPLSRMQTMMQLREELHAKLEGVLTPEQLAQFEEQQQQRIGGVLNAVRQAGINPAAGGPPRGPGERRERIMQLLQPAVPAPATQN